MDSNVSGPDQKDDDYSMDSVDRYYAKDSDDSDEEDSYDSEEEEDEDSVIDTFIYEGVVFKPGFNIAPYWLVFLKDRVNLKLPIKDLVTFQKCKFILNDEHIFGNDSRMSMAMKACDHVCFKYHTKISDYEKRFKRKERTRLLRFKQVSQVYTTQAYRNH